MALFRRKKAEERVAEVPPSLNHTLDVLQRLETVATRLNQITDRIEDQARERERAERANRADA